MREAIVAALDHDSPGFSVSKATSVADARAMLNGVDVALLDLGLADGDGADLISELMAMNPQAIAIVITSSIEPAVTERAMERGAAAVLSKLTDLGEIVATVNRLHQRATP